MAGSETTVDRIEKTVRLIGWIALVAIVLTVGLIIFGAWVRASGSGLGCPDWPLCYGAVVPELEGETAIEYGHRVYAGIVMLVVAVGAVFSYQTRRSMPQLAWLMIGTFALLIVQAVLGGITVLTELHGMFRFAHLVLAMITLGLLTAAAIQAFNVRPSVSPGMPLAYGLLGLTAIVMLVGGLIVWHGVGPGCPGLLLCDERSTTTAAWLHNIHRITAALLVVALLAVAIRMMRFRGTRLAIGLTHASTFLAASQILIGVLAVMQTLPEGLRVLHVGVATLIWWFVVALWVLAYKARRI